MSGDPLEIHVLVHSTAHFRGPFMGFLEVESPKMQIENICKMGRFVLKTSGIPK